MSHINDEKKSAHVECDEGQHRGGLGRQITQDNSTAVIENILTGQSKEQLIAGADQFVSKFGIPESDREVFRKAALLAQRPHSFQSIDDLSPEEKHDLQ